MALRTVLGGSALVLAAAVSASLALPQEKEEKEKGPGGAPDMAEMMKQWEALSTPGKNHKFLEPLVGEWDATFKVWYGGPGTPAVESKGTEVDRWVLGGRFIQEEYEGRMQMPDPSGSTKTVPFKGLGLIGYDNYRNVYVSTWADSLGTQILTMTGSCDPSGKVFDYYGQMDEPALKLVGRMVRYVTRIVDKDHHTSEMYDLHAGPDYKVMEISYSRKKA